MWEPVTVEMVSGYCVPSDVSDKLCIASFVPGILDVSDKLCIASFVPGILKY